MVRLLYHRRILFFQFACICVLFIVLILTYSFRRRATPVVAHSADKEKEYTELSFKINQLEKLVLSSVQKTCRQALQNQNLSNLNSSDPKRFERQGNQLGKMRLNSEVQDQQQTAKDDADPPALNTLDSSQLTRDPMRDFQHQNGLIKFGNPASCTPIPALVVLYNRIFKTGSETMGLHFQLIADMMGYRYAKKTTEDFYDQGTSYPFPEIIENATRGIQGQMVFNAHFYFRNNLNIQLAHTYINQVREPVARYLSHYSYMHNARHRPPERLKEMIDSGEIRDTVEECFDKKGQGCKHNVMTRFFCGPENFCKKDPKKALEMAKENIVKYYGVVGLLEHFNLTLKIIQKRLPCFLPIIPLDPGYRDNQSKIKMNASSVSEEIISKIKLANWADMELYEFVKHLFWRQVKACGLPKTVW